MSKLDNIIIECVNKALDQKEEKLGDYIDPTKQQIKDLVKELWNETDKETAGQEVYEGIKVFQEKVEEL